jgi:TolA-binding protein
MPEQPVAAPAQPVPEPVVSPPAETQKTTEPGFTVAPVMTTHTDNANPALDARLGQLLDRMNAVEAKLADVQKQSTAADLQTMQQTLSQISSRLDKLEAQKSTAIVVHPSAAAADAAPAAQPAVSPKVKTRAAARPAGKQAAPRWVLKSAQPGQAYVSRPGQADMISVHIGDTLQGIGHVTAIDAAGGRWIIHGTQGSISQ